MAWEWAAAVSPVWGLLVNVVVQVSLTRWFRLRLLKSVFAGFFMGFGATLAPLALADPGSAPWADRVFPGLTSLLAYASLGYGYFHFLNLGETARRIRILREIHESPKGGLTVPEILERYNAREMLEKRFKRLLENGQVAEENGVYRIRPSLMLVLTRMFGVLRRLVLGRDSEGKPGSGLTPPFS